MFSGVSEKLCLDTAVADRGAATDGAFACSHNLYTPGVPLTTAERTGSLNGNCKYLAHVRFCSW